MDLWRRTLPDGHPPGWLLPRAPRRRCGVGRRGRSSCSAIGWVASRLGLPGGCTNGACVLNTNFWYGRYLINNNKHDYAYIWHTIVYVY